MLMNNSGLTIVREKYFINIAETIRVHTVNRNVVKIINFRICERSPFDKLISACLPVPKI